MSKKDICKN